MFNVVNGLFVIADLVETPVFLTFNLLVETSTSRVLESILKDIVFELESFNNGLLNVRALGVPVTILYYY